MRTKGNYEEQQMLLAVGLNWEQMASEETQEMGLQTVVGSKIFPLTHFFLNPFCQVGK